MLAWQLYDASPITNGNVKRLKRTQAQKGVVVIMRNISLSKMSLNQLKTLATNKLKLVALSVTTAFLLSCASTTNMGATGVDRKQLLLVSSQEITQLSLQQYSKTLSEAKAKGLLDTNKAQLRRLQRIADRITAQVGVFRADAARWPWEVHTLKSKQLNAYVSPGGKIMFYTGIIDRLKLTDDEIAAIMGHEIAHALREHARERISTQMASQMGLGILAQAAGLSANQVQLASMVSQLGVGLPHNRSQESEADVIGLELMARAGYNPEASISLWRKMQGASKGEPPQFLSTHPSSSSRIAQLQALMPRVMPLYRK